MRSMNRDLYSLIENYINSFREKNSFAPTIEETANGTGIPRSTVGRYLKRMKNEGIIDYNGARAVVTPEEKKYREETVRVPVLGNVSCGIPKLAVENIEEYVRLPRSLFGNGDFFFLRAAGDSMTGAGINEGDLVLIKQSDTAREGQIVVALIDDDATLKRFYPEKNRIRLHPENEKFEDIYVDDCIIQGVAVKVLRSLE